MSGLRDVLEGVRQTIESGYYRRPSDKIRPAPSLVAALGRSRVEHGLSLVAEVDPRANLGARPRDGGQAGVMRSALAAGACALSVVTEPRRSHGRLPLLREAVALGAPTLMQDDVVAEVQVDCAAALGASAVTLRPGFLPLERLRALVEYAHLADREVVLECADRAELEGAASTEADVLAAAVRDPVTFRSDPEHAFRALHGFEADRPVLVTGAPCDPAYVARLRALADGFVMDATRLPRGVTLARLLHPPGATF